MCCRSRAAVRTAARLPVALLGCCLAVAASGCGRSDLPAPSVSVHAQAAPAAAPAVALPNKDGSFKFAVLGDFGTGERTQYELAQQMDLLHRRFNYSLVVLVGDNLYGSERP